MGMLSCWVPGIGISAHFDLGGTIGWPVQDKQPFFFFKQKLIIMSVEGPHKANKTSVVSAAFPTINHPV